MPFLVIPERQKLSGFGDGRSGQLAKVSQRADVPINESRTAGAEGIGFYCASATDLTLEPACSAP
jgi:hypothetical protein